MGSRAGQGFGRADGAGAARAGAGSVQELQERWQGLSELPGWEEFQDR